MYLVHCSLQVRIEPDTDTRTLEYTREHVSPNCRTERIICYLHINCRLSMIPSLETHRMSFANNEVQNYHFLWQSQIWFCSKDMSSHCTTEIAHCNASRFSLSIPIMLYLAESEGLFWLKYVFENVRDNENEIIRYRGDSVFAMKKTRRETVTTSKRPPWKSVWMSRFLQGTTWLLQNIWIYLEYVLK